MGDMGEIFRDMTEAKKQRHADWNKAYTTTIQNSGIPHKSVNGGEALLFRELGMPKVDFYPSTGRWRVAGTARTFSGGAVSFIAWYEKRRK
jgi:hypothetical protein